MKRYGSELIFISRIFGNGKQIETMKIVDNNGYLSIWNNGRQLTNVPFVK